MDAEERIIMALDVDDIDDALALVAELKYQVGYFKIGLEFINAMLSSLILSQTDSDIEKTAYRICALFDLLKGKIFWDGKFDDIPNTVGKASAVVSGLKVAMFNVHASCGIEAMKQAVANKGNSMVLAVTVLTSLSDIDSELIFGKPTKTKVLHFAEDSVTAGMDGIICSPKELISLKDYKEFNNLKRIVPGIRPKWAVVGDQKRVMTPAEAIENGADYLVIGRPITQPPDGMDCLEAVQKIVKEIESASTKK